MKVKLYGTDRSPEWNEAVGQIPGADIYFTSEYCRIYELNGEGEAQLFVYQEGDGLVCYPYLLRRLSDVPVCRSLGIGDGLYDICTPYGYGGPISNETDECRRSRLFRNFTEAFREYCRERGIVTEFVRFHPILQNYRDYSEVSPRFERNTIHVDLTAGDEQIMQSYSRDNRNRIRKALKEGLTVKQSDRHDIGSLLDLYYGTMDKKQAHSYYYFPSSFFLNTIRLLDGHIELFEVCLGNRVVASSLFMHYNRYVHYHLMGSDKEFLSLAPVNLLIHSAVLWAKRRGYSYLHLGGGYAGNDSLYRFKRSFNETARNDFHTGQKVHLTDTYVQIVRELEWAKDSAYFPVYRRPDLQPLCDKELTGSSLL